MSQERLLRDVFLLLEACLATRGADDVEALAEALISRLCTTLTAATGLLFVRAPLLEGEQAEPDAFVAVPARRAAILRAAPVAAERVAAAMARSGPSVLLAEDAIAEAPAGFAHALSVPVPPHGVLELYAATSEVFDPHTARVLSTLASYLDARLRCAARECEISVRASAMRAERDALEELVDALPGAAWQVDARGQPTYVSTQARAMFGAPAGHPRASGLHPEDRARVDEELARATAERRPELTLRYRVVRGDAELEIEERVSFSRDDRGAELATSFAVDVTAARAALRRVEELDTQRAAGARAQALRVDVERAAREKTEFLSLLSHELRAPLFPIIALSDLLLRADDARARPEDWREQIRMINGAGKQMLQLVGDLVEISRVDSGRTRPRVSRVALAHVATTLLERGAERARPRGAELKVRLAPDAATEVFTDRAVLERIANGLVSHALEGLESDQVSLEIDASGGELTLSLSARAAAPERMPADLEAVFDPFWERPTGARGAGHGHGLALTLVRSLAAGFGGRVRAEIAPTHRRFDATIPCAPPGGAVAYTRPPRTALCSAHIRATFATALWLHALGVEPVLLESAAELVAGLESPGYDLVMVDCRLPGLRLLDDALLSARTAGRRRPMVVALARAEDTRAVSGAVVDLTLRIPPDRERVAAILARF